MTRLSRAAARLLFIAALLACLGVEVLGCWGVEARWSRSVPNTSTPQHLNTPTPQHFALDASVDLPDPHVVHGPAWMDRNGDRVDDRLEQLYRRDHKAGLQVAG